MGRSSIILHDVWWSTKRKIRQFTNRLQDLSDPSGGSYSMQRYTGAMTATHKLIFVISFMWMMQWGTRVTAAAINALS